MSSGLHKTSHKAERALLVGEMWPGAGLGPSQFSRHTMPRGRHCKTAACITILSVHNRGVYCAACAQRIGYEVHAEHPGRGTCKCGEPREIRRSNGKHRGYYNQCAACRIRTSPTHCATCGEPIPDPKWDKRYCGVRCRRRAANRVQNNRRRPATAA